MRSSVFVLLVGVVLVAGCTAESGGSGEPRPTTAISAPPGTYGGVDAADAAVTTSIGDDPSATTTDVAVEVAFDDLSGRAAHTATTLLTGEVLVAGGCVSDGCGVATAETFIVAADGESVVRGPELAGPRDGHTAHALANGSVVLIGGYAGEGQPPLSLVELYDAGSEQVRRLDDLNQRRGGHTSALLSGDRVIVIGGWIARRTYTRSAEIVDVSSGSVSEAAPLPVALHAMDAVTLADGRVPVTGGQLEASEGTDAAWIYDESSNSWSETGVMTSRRFKHFSVLLPDGNVLVIGGTTDDQEILATTEIYDPVAGTFTRGPDLVEPRYKLPGGAVVVDGGQVVIGGGGQTIERIDLATQTSTVLADLGSQGSFATTTTIGDQGVLVLGGYDRNISLRRQAFLIPNT